MKRLAALLLVAACVQEEKTLVQVDHPDTAEGEYAVSWGGVAVVTLEAAHLSPLPCGVAGIGCSYTYDPASGELVAEGKALDGGAKLELSGVLDQVGLRGAYRVLVLGVECSSGAVTWTRSLKP